MSSAVESRRAFQRTTSRRCRLAIVYSLHSTGGGCGGLVNVAHLILLFFPSQRLFGAAFSALQYDLHQ
jgi:hypothetical protein